MCACFIGLRLLLLVIFQEGTTALIVAAEVNNFDIVKLLIKYGAKPNITNKVMRIVLLLS